MKESRNCVPISEWCVLLAIMQKHRVLLSQKEIKNKFSLFLSLLMTVCFHMGSLEEYH